MNTSNSTFKNLTNTHDSLLAICLYAAFSNGEQADAERQEIARYAEEMDADQLAGSALSFASTYAIGHIAQTYYAGGRTLAAPDLKKLVGPLQNNARELHTRYLPEIQERAKTLDSAAILSLVRGSTPV